MCTFVRTDVLRDENRQEEYAAALKVYYDGFNHFQAFTLHAAAVTTPLPRRRSTSIMSNTAVRRSARLESVRQSSLERSPTPDGWLY